MKLSAALSLLERLKDALNAALMPTLKTLYRNPAYIFQLSRVFMAHLWAAFGPPLDQFNACNKEALLTPNAQGVVVDLGAGLGHTAQYLDHSKVTTYVAIEPNTLMHPKLRETAAKAGFFESDNSLILLSCGAEDTLSILNALGGNLHSIDTVVSILTVCSIPDAENAITRLIRDVLRPGGQLLIFEHVRSPREDVAWWQRVWSPLWTLFFDGCRLDCATDRWIEGMKDVDGAGKEVGMWKEGKIWKPLGSEEDEEHLLYHLCGKFVKVG